MHGRGPGRPPAGSASVTGHKRIGIIEFTAQDTRLGALLAPDVAWHSSSHELKPSMKSSPPDAVVFHVQLDDRADIADALKDAAATNPRVRMMLAASSSQAVLIAEITSISLHRAASHRAGLSEREMQVLRAIKVGYTNREIASQLGISISTANKHVENILRKMSVRNRTQAAAQTAEGEPSLPPVQPADTSPAGNPGRNGLAAPLIQGSSPTSIKSC